jgi:hypothetical protein
MRVLTLLLRQRGAEDARAGKSIEAFYDVKLPGLRHNEFNRGSYEIGYRAEHAEMNKMSRKFEIIWPEKKLVSAEKILGWYRDAVMNGEIDGPEDPTSASPVFAARMLDEAGLITLSGGKWRTK